MVWRMVQCRHVQVSELLSIEKCDNAVMDILVATDVKTIQPNMGGGLRPSGQQVEDDKRGGLSLTSSRIL